MQLRNMIARPHLFGNRIDLQWENPFSDDFPGVRVVRRTSTHPVSPDDGQIVSERNALVFVAGSAIAGDLDNSLLPQSLLDGLAANGYPMPHDAAVKVDTDGSRWLISGSGMEFAARLTSAGIGIYKRGVDTAQDTQLKGGTVYYYTLFPFRGNPPEFVLENRNRLSAMATDRYNAAAQMYDLLPRIYHRYDTQRSGSVQAEDLEKGSLLRFLEIAGGELDQLHSFARAIGRIYSINDTEGSLLPLLAQWIGWKPDYSAEIDTRRNQIRHAPALYKTIGMIPPVEATVKRMSGWDSRTKEFVHNVCASNRPERLNLRVKKSAGAAWAGTGPGELISLDSAFDGRPSAVDDAGVVWLFYHSLKKRKWQEDGSCRTVSDIRFKTYRDGSGWSESGALVSRGGIDKSPSAAMHGGRLLLFWSTHDAAGGQSRIRYRVRSGDAWGPAEHDEAFAGNAAERRNPLAVADSSGGLWLFWMELSAGRWVMKYNRHNGTAWQLSPAADFPLDAGAMDQAFALHNPSDAARPLYIFWTGKTAVAAPGRTRRRIFYRFKQGNDPAVSDWSAVRNLPAAAGGDDYHDCEPSAIMRGNRVEVFWSSTRDGSWSIWSSLLLAPAANTWQAAAPVTSGPYSERNSLPVSAGADTILVHRSNQHVAYQSGIYPATGTTDLRYSGSTTADTRNSRKIALRGAFEDFQTYTCDPGKKNEDWYARDTIGLYLEPDTMDEERIAAGIERVRNVLDEFMPITDRAVFIAKADVHTEHVYSYDLPLSGSSRFIGESHGIRK